MRNRSYKHVRIFAIILIVIIIFGVAKTLYVRNDLTIDAHSPTAQFIEDHMINANGTIASYLQDDSSDNADIVSGREALSESLGLWMQYALLQGDQTLFDHSYEILNNTFLTPQNYITWKLQADGKSKVNTNALGDDFRIVGALLKAADQWNQGREKYITTAMEISKTLLRSVQKNGYFVDFHDFSNNVSTDTLSLVYVDISTLRLMNQHHMINSATYDVYTKLLTDMPDDGLFYPRTFNVNTKQYSYDDSVNLIDQLIVANHLAEMDRESKPLIGFLKEEFDQRHQLMGRYNRASRMADVNYESPSVYGLTILLALKSGETEWAKELYQHMVSLRDPNTSYKGGYVFDQNTHVFDNLFPLLAETSLKDFLEK